MRRREKGAGPCNMPVMGLQRTPVQQFGGLNTITPAYDTDGSDAVDLLNVRYPNGEVDQETIQQRKGHAPRLSGWANGAQVSTVPFDAGIAYPNGGSPLNALILFGDGDIFLGIPENGIPPTIARLFDGGVYTGRYAACVHAIPGGVSGVYIAPQDAQVTVPAHQFYNGVVIGAWTSNFPGANNIIRSLVSWRGRLCAIGLDVSRIYYTPVGSTDFTASGSGSIDIFDQVGSSNRELQVHNNNLYLFKEESLWMLYDPVTFANRMITNVGVGRSLIRRLTVSCPVDRRLYWFNPSNGLIYSSNGETDLVPENLAAPIPSPKLDLLGVGPPVTVSSHIQVAYAPESQSIVVNWPTVPNVVTYADRLDELCIRIGKPGAHPITRHAMNTRALINGYIRDTSSGSLGGYRPELLVSGPATLNKIYGAFGQVGSDDGVIIPSNWQGGWMPIISEEPWERVRRVNFIYRGHPTIEVTSSMTLQSIGTAPTVSLASANYVGDGTDTDRTFVTLHGPNKRGRYHKLGIRGPGIVGQEFSVSALELAIRGGKGKK